MNDFLLAVLSHFEAKADSVFCRFVRGEAVEELRWRDIELGAGAFLGAYRSLELPNDGLILIFLRHVPELYGSFLGAMLGGFRPSFMPCASPKQDPRLYWSSHARLFAHIRPAAVVADRATLAEMSANGLDLNRTKLLAIEDLTPAKPVWRLPDDDQVALLQHSSGTTGLKKGVALSYRSITKQIESYMAAINHREDDVLVSWLPLYHDMGLIACFLMPIYGGMPVVHIDPFDWLARPGRLFEHIERWQGTLTWLPNFAFEYLATMSGRDAAKYRLESVRAWINCSEPCRASSFDRFARTFAISGVSVASLHCCYAMAETVFAIAQTDPDRPAPRIWCDRSSLERGSRIVVGQPGEGSRELLASGSLIDGVSITVVDENRQPVSEGYVGEIAVSGDFLFSGYNQDADRTRTQLVDGRFFTRDLGFVADGLVYVLGRIDDLIIVNGRNVYAHEIENLLSTVAGLKPGRSVALPWEDIRNGTQGLMIVAERVSGTVRTDAEIRSEVLSRVLSVTSVMARAVHLFDEGWLAKTTSGKVSRELNAKKIAAVLLAEGETRNDR